MTHFIQSPGEADDDGNVFGDFEDLEAAGEEADHEANSENEEEQQGEKGGEKTPATGDDGTEEEEKR